MENKSCLVFWLVMDQKMPVFNMTPCIFPGRMQSRFL